MDPLIALLLGVFVGSLFSGCLVWWTTRPDRAQSISDPLRVLRGMVGKGILPSHVWEQVSRELRLESNSGAKEKAAPAHPSKGPGYVWEETPTSGPSHWALGTRLVLGLWCFSGLLVLAKFQSSSWLMVTAAVLLGSAVWGLVKYQYLLKQTAMRFAWFWAGVAGWTVASLGSQGSELDPQKLMFAGLAGLSSGLGAMVALNASLRRKVPSRATILVQAVLLFGPIFLLPADFGKWDAESRDWAQVLPVNWLPFAGAGWALSLAARSSFAAPGMVAGLSFLGCWIAGWTAIQFSGSGQGRGLPSFALGAFFATAFTAILCRLVAKPEARTLGKFPTGPLSFMVTLFLSGCATTVWMSKVGFSPAWEAALLFAGSLCAWVALALLGRNLWGVASLSCLLGSIAYLAIYMHNGVPILSWWPFMAKFTGLGLSIGTLGWCLAQGRFPSRKSLPFVCVTSLAGVVGWLLPTQALVMATLVEPSWMSEVIRAPLAGWWNLPLAVFSVGMAWWMHRSLPGMRPEIWLTQFVLIFAGIATAWATLGLDTEESPRGVLAVLGSWSLGAMALGLFRSRWSSIFATVFLGFAWFLAWSQTGRLPSASPLWSLAPACAAWLMGSFHSLIHGKRWVMLGSAGAVMAGLSAWSAFESVHLGPGLLIGALLMALNLMVLEVRHNRDWLAPQNYKKALRLREPSLWLGICQTLILVGSFLTVRESGHGGWLAVGLAAQSVILWIVRGSASSTLAQLQGFGAAMTGGLIALGAGESLDAQAWFPRILEAVPSLAFFVPGALAGIGVQLLVSRLTNRSMDRGPQFALGVLALPALFTLGQSVFPSTDPSQWVLALVTSILWPILAWFTGNQAVHGSRQWYQTALVAMLIPVTLVGISLCGLSGVGAYPICMAATLACALIAGWCLIAPHVEVSWSLPARQAFTTTGRRLLGLAQFPLVLMVGFSQDQGDSGFSGGYWLAMTGICLATLVSAISANEQRSSRKAMRLQAFCLSFVFLGWVWVCGILQFTPPMGRISTFLLGSACILLSASPMKLVSRWKTVLQVGGTFLQLALLAGIGASLVVGTNEVGLLANWGVDAFTLDWKPWVLEVSLLSLLLGIMGRFGAGDTWHPSIRMAFLAWAAVGWIGLSVATQGATAPGFLLATAGMVSGAYLARRQSGVIPLKGSEILNRDVA